MILDIMPIPLTQGLFALIDGANYEELSQYKWHAHKNENTFYAVRCVGKGLNHQRILMHRQILGLTKGDGKETDHKNHYGLDNRLDNLRVCTHGQNKQNQKLGYGSSKYKGVYWNKENKRWRAGIGHNHQVIYLGCFNDETEAAKAYDQKAKKLFGEFANTNF